MNLATMPDLLETNWLITSHYYYSFRKYIHTYLFGWSIVLLLLMKIFESIGVGVKCHADED